jgi:hypothetical protein
MVAMVIKTLTKDKKTRFKDYTGLTGFDVQISNVRCADGLCT